MSKSNIIMETDRLVECYPNEEVDYEDGTPADMD